jgi:hypothetical protein
MSAFTAMAKGEPIQPRKKRAIEIGPREQPERELRNQIIKELRKRGIKVMRVEPCFGKYNIGIPDLWVMNINKNIAAWFELKSDHGILKPHQKQFREDCLRCNVKHYVIRSISDALEAIL